jgi:hypothetical protein
MDQASCSRCGKYAFLGFECVDEESKRTLICSECAKELKAEIGKLAPAVFGTTLDERRAKIKGEEKEK